MPGSAQPYHLRRQSFHDGRDQRRALLHAGRHDHRPLRRLLQGSRQYPDADLRRSERDPLDSPRHRPDGSLRPGAAECHPRPQHRIYAPHGKGCPVSRAGRERADLYQPASSGGTSRRISFPRSSFRPPITLQTPSSRRQASAFWASASPPRSPAGGTFSPRAGRSSPRPGGWSSIRVSPPPSPSWGLTSSATVCGTFLTRTQTERKQPSR